MRAVTTILVAYALVVTGHAQTPAPSPEPTTLDQVPWTPLVVTQLPLLKLPVIQFKTATAVEILKGIGLILSIVPGDSQNESTVFIQGLDASPVISLSLFAAALPTLRQLPVNEQVGVLEALLDGWMQVYRTLGQEALGLAPENHFAIARAALLTRARTEGITADVLAACGAYRAQLAQALQKN